MRILQGKGLTIAASIAALAATGVLTAQDARAGAFAVREQSAYFQGMSFAGSAAGNELSSMFWNSAAAAAKDGINTESHGSLVIPHTEINATGGALANPVFGLETESGDIGSPTFVPSSYANYQLTDRLYVGLATNAQYGFTTKPENLDFVGTPLATTSEVFSININPNVAYKLTPELTVGVGAQILYADVRLRSSNTANVNAIPGLAAATDREVEVDDWAFGATAGVIWQPSPNTSLGIGYRSAIEVNAEGTCVGNSSIGALSGAPGCGATPIGVGTSLTLPDLVTASFSQRVSERFKVLGTVEWTNWSRVGAEAVFEDDAGNPVDVFPLGYDDGWFFSGGVEYAYSPYTTLRGGLGYEISPIPDEERNVSLPDNDRVWLSVGASTKLTESIEIDLAYTHLFVEDAPINTGDGALLQAESTGDIDIISASFKYKWGGAEPALEPLK